MDLGRRAWLATLAGGWLPAAMAATGTRIAATWRDGDGHRLGLLAPRAGALQATATLALPTRAHGLLRLRDGRLLAVARRPGDWLLRWDAGSGRAEWIWAEPGRSFNGHVRASADGRRLYTSEADRDSGQGLIGVRDAATLRKLAEWPTLGLDPHDIAVDADGSLLVANGGIETRPETGRIKLRLDRMDSSLVRLHGTTGAVQGQWRLPDRRLGLRHLAWSAGAGGRVLGIALQAEHDEAGTRAAAPVLALFDGRGLRAVAAPEPLAGYGGDITAVRGLFAVSCPRRDAVALFDAQGAARGLLPTPSACALAGGGGTLWVGGKGQALQVAGGAPHALTTGLELDNHWLAPG